eukprot:6207904-Pleurochrysis_carterae.AAC.1
MIWPSGGRGSSAPIAVSCASAAARLGSRGRRLRLRSWHRFPCGVRGSGARRSSSSSSSDNTASSSGAI